MKTNHFAVRLDDDELTQADILFDLGSLLSTYDSAIARKEAFECLRRSLDVKSLYLGVGHVECARTEELLNGIIQSTNRQESSSSMSIMERINSSRVSLSSLLNQAALMGGDGTRPSTRSSAFGSCSSAASRGAHRLTAKSRQADSDRRSRNEQELNAWISQNSLIEVIPVSGTQAAANLSPKSSTLIETRTVSSTPKVYQLFTLFPSYLFKIT